MAEEENNQVGNHSTQQSQELNESIKKLASGLFKERQKLDIGSLMSMAANLVSNEELMKTVDEIAKMEPNKQVESLEVQEPEPEQEPDPILLLQRMNEMASELAQLQQELKQVKEQNKMIEKTVMKLYKRADKKE